MHTDPVKGIGRLRGARRASGRGAFALAKEPGLERSESGKTERLEMMFPEKHRRGRHRAGDDTGVYFHGPVVSRISSHAQVGWTRG